MAIVFLAALDRKPGTLERADALARRLVDEGVWSVVDQTEYLVRPPQARLAWWASGAPLRGYKYTPGMISMLRKGYESWLGPLLPGWNAYKGYTALSAAAQYGRDAAGAAASGFLWVIYVGGGVTAFLIILAILIVVTRGK